MVAPKLITAHLFLWFAAAALADIHTPVNGASSNSRVSERMVEWTVTSHKTYEDPFNDVEVDVLFTKDGQSWRVPTFWRGGQEWTVRFAPPTPGEWLLVLEAPEARVAEPEAALSLKRSCPTECPPLATTIAR